MTSGNREKFRVRDQIAGELQDLLKCLIDLSSRLGMNTVPSAGLDIEAVVFRKLVRSHQRVKIGFLAGFEEFTGLL